MNVALLFFLLLVPLSGFIAWAGDRIGHKSGKKRHTLFGLRPRHTATLITIAAGMCISLVSFGIMWAISGTFREVMARGAELLQENKQLSQEKKQLSQDNQAALRQVSRNIIAVKKAEEDKREAEADFQKAKTSLASAQHAMQAANANLRTTKNKLGVTQKSLTNAEQQVEDARKQVARANTDFQRAEAHTRKAQTEARNAEAQVRIAQARTREKQQELGKARHTFEVTTQYQSESLGRQAKLLETQRTLLETQTAQLSSQRTELARLSGELTSLTSEKEQRMLEVNAAKAAIEKFRTTTTALRGRQITYRVGEEVDRLSIPAGISIWRIEAILDSLLTSAAKKAEAKGAKRVTENARAVALLPQATMLSLSAPSFGSVPERGPNATVSLQTGQPVLPLISELDLLRAAADAIRRENKDVVVVVVTSANAVAGEPVAVDLRTFHNPVVLNAGTTVGEITVDGSASRQEIIDALYGFLRRDVRSRLLKAGVIPPLVGGDSSETPRNQLVSETEAGNIFTLSGDAWLKIMDDIRRAGSQARVIVRVDKTSHAADPVSLRFDVKRGRDSRPLPDRSDSGSKGMPGGAPSGLAIR